MFKWLINSMSKKNTVTTVILSKDTYAALKSKIPTIYCNKDTTSEQLAFIAGQQSVLEMLREGWVVE